MKLASLFILRHNRRSLDRNNAPIDRLNLLCITSEHILVKFTLPLIFSLRVHGTIAEKKQHKKTFRFYDFRSSLLHEKSIKSIIHGIREKWKVVDSMLFSFRFPPLWKRTEISSRDIIMLRIKKIHLCHSSDDIFMRNHKLNLTKVFIFVDPSLHNGTVQTFIYRLGVSRIKLL